MKGFSFRGSRQGEKLGQLTIPRAPNSYTPAQGSTNFLVDRPNRRVLSTRGGRPSKEKVITLIFNVTLNYLLLEQNTQLVISGI